MGVKYIELKFNSRDHERVSRQWFVLLWDLSHHDHVHFNVNEGHRTMARQQELVNEQGVWSSSNPHGAALPSDHAPHIKTGHPNHAIDFDNSEGVIRAARKRGVTLLRTVSTESWHVEPDAAELFRYYKKHHRRVWRESTKHKVVHKVKKTLKIPTHASDKLVDFLAEWEGEMLVAYQVPGESFWTIGVGHTGEVNGRKPHRGMKISRKMSRKLLHQDLAHAEADVRRLVPRQWRRKQHRFDTCVSLAFNLGSEILTAKPPLDSFGKVLSMPVNHKTIDLAVAAIHLYVKGGSPLRPMPGLVKRREAEGQMFKHGRYPRNS